MGSVENLLRIVTPGRSTRGRARPARSCSPTAAQACAAALVALLFVALCADASAHPAVGIVIDRAGAVYFSDTQQVWRIGPDGSKSIAVPDVHTHELWLDAGGNLFGEHLRYVDGRWEHRVWKRSPDGQVGDVIGMRSGFREDYRDFFFSRDADGAMYWLEGSAPVLVRRRIAGGRIETIARLAVRDPVWLSATPAGAVLLSSYGLIWRVSPDGRVTQLRAAASGSSDRHAVMGLTEDGTGNVYAAVYADRAVRRITPSGEITTVATTPEPWSPTGVAVGPDGAVWVLEVSVTNAQRVRRIDPGGGVRVY